MKETREMAPKCSGIVTDLLTSSTILDSFSTTRSITETCGVRQKKEVRVENTQKTREKQND